MKSVEIKKSIDTAKNGSFYVEIPASSDVAIGDEIFHVFDEKVRDRADRFNRNAFKLVKKRTSLIVEGFGSEYEDINGNLVKRAYGKTESKLGVEAK